MIKHKSVYCIPGGWDKGLTSRDCVKYFKTINEKVWQTFDDYSDHIRTVHVVKFEKKDWLKSHCSCVYWAKNYFCHHVVGLAVSKKKAVFQDIHMNIPIGQTRPRGQPKKTASALTRQKGVAVSSDSSADSTKSEEPSPLKKKRPTKKQQKKTPKKRGPKPKSK